MPRLFDALMDDPLMAVVGLHRLTDAAEREGITFTPAEANRLVALRLAYQLKPVPRLLKYGVRDPEGIILVGNPEA